MNERLNTAFSEIQSFVDLSNDILQSYKSVALWNRLINNPNSTNDDLTKERCIKAFTNFCVRFKNQITNDEISFDDNCKYHIKYSDRMYIDVKELWKKANSNDKTVIKNYLLTLSALLIKDDNALKLLNDREDKKSPMDVIKDSLDKNTKEDVLLGNIVDKLGGVMETLKDKEDVNVQDVIMNLMGNGLMNDVLNDAKSKYENGDIKISGMLNSFTNLAKKLEEQTKD